VDFRLYDTANATIAIQTTDAVSNIKHTITDDPTISHLDMSEPELMEVLVCVVEGMVEKEEA
jgi:hypothetical protein